MHGKEIGVDYGVRILLNEMELLKETQKWRTIVYPDTSIPRNCINFRFG